MKKDKYSIYFVLPNLNGGGAERVALTLLRRLDRGKFDPRLIVFQGQGVLKREIPKDIAVYDLKADRVLKGWPPFTALIRKEHPDVLFSTLTHLNLAVLLGKSWFSTRTKIVIRETTILSRNLPRLRFPSFWKLMLRHLYPRSDRIICSCQAMAEDLENILGKKMKKLWVIPNPIDREEIEKKSRAEDSPFLRHGPGPHILAVGRLGPEKGMDRLIRSFPRLANRNSEAKLWILGSGEEENDLRSLIRKLHLEDRVFLMGFRHNPYPWMVHAHLFVLPSLFEGSPNALLEALALGVPVVVCEQEGGAREVLERVCLLDRYVSSLDLWPETWWQRPGDETICRLEEHYGIHRVVTQYEALFSDLCNNP